MTRSVGQLDEDRMMNRLPDIARKIRTYFVQIQRNVVPFKKVIDQLKQSYPEAMTDRNLNCIILLNIILLIIYIRYFRRLESSLKSSSGKSSILDCIKNIRWR